MYCPICSSKSVKLSSEYLSNKELPESGIYVAKTIDKITEFYDDAYPFECSDCVQIFYLGYKINEEKLKKD